MAQRAWRDGKRYLWPLGVAISAIPIAAVWLNAVTGWGGWLWLGPFVILAVIPTIDLAVGTDAGNPPDDAVAALEADRYYRWVTYAFLPVFGIGFALSLWYIATAGLSTVESVAMAITLGMSGGLAINTAHELGHKRDDVERWLARVALAPVAYGHFYVEHNRGHHVRVATPEDPASSRLGESFYAFWPRTVAGSLRSAWRLESRRLRRRGRRAWSPGNDVLNAWALSVVVWVAVVLWLGPGILPYLVVQAVVAFTLLEAVNYLEHYGLLRQRVGSGDRERYERVEPRHSWNSNHLATNLLLFHLQRHSDHHANPTRRYQALRDFPDAPALPTGYAGMILLALVPPLWRRVMDPRLLAHLDGDVSRANIAPRARARVLARYSVGSPAGGPVAPGGQQTAARTQDTAAVPAAASAASETATPDVSGATAAGCPGCGYVYDERAGAPREGFPAGTPWARIPDTWCCPDCGVRDKADFEMVTLHRDPAGA